MADTAQQMEGLFVFDTLGNHGQIQFLAERADRLEQDKATPFL
ncbi:hypothetical protein RM530_16165 [Algiphilus sp. W345]|uniref:Uncharacterized protein n=1 Tax=Banduia mediterranea TaxID=3075609 RepID=A0ABU2WLY9_9GAMM|nr:hypothetical protein [Algiphilus sp. W345]MDT0498885.1 hypothetical protein [Algiphilus sp. W345]